MDIGIAVCRQREKKKRNKNRNRNSLITTFYKKILNFIAAPRGYFILEANFRGVFVKYCGESRLFLQKERIIMRVVIQENYENILQQHNNAIIACDEPACGELTVDTYKYFLDIEKGERI